MLTKEQVIWAYRILLDRDPESETVIEEKQQCPSIRALADAFMESGEFFDKHSYVVAARNRWVMVEHDLGFRIWVNTADTAVSWGIINNVFEPDESDFVRRHVKEGDSVIDIGANLGFFSLLSSRLVGPTGHVLGFEPLTFLHAAAIRSVRENHFDHCEIHNVALASQRGEAQLIYAPGSPNWGGAFLSFDGSSLPDHASVTVPIAPLADFVDGFNAGFVKIDVEGAEHVVLNSCKDYLAQTRPVVMSEIHRAQLERVSQVHPADYVGLMASLGYVCREIVKGGHGDLGDIITGHEAFDLISVAFLPG